MKRIVSTLAIAFVTSAIVNGQVVNATQFNGRDLNATGAVQNPLNLGNWSNPTSVAQYQFYTTDQGSQPLTIHSTRYSGGLILTRGSATGTVNMAAFSGWSGVGASMNLYNNSNQVAVVISANGGDSYINAGNLAIGTTSAQGYKLAVNGSAIFTQAKVKLFANWPDYVFDNDYSLRPLSEVEKFIKQHRHLPEVPSAAEVTEHGLDLGANQAILLKKIEELTLYIIELEKKVEKLQKDQRSSQ